MVSVIKYKNIDPKEFSVEPPVKKGNQHASKITYSSQRDVLVQTPDLEAISPDTFRFKIVNNGLFFTILEDIQEQIAKVLFDNSAEYFNGKSFSKERIEKSIVDLVEVRDDGFAYVNGITLDSEAKFIDFLEDSVATPQDYPYSGRFMIKFSHVLYDKTTFQVKIQAKSCKLSLKKDTSSNVKEYLFDDEVRPSSQNVVEEPEPVQETIEEESNQENCVDDLDFF
jgi:hypothetical protein